MIEAPSSPENEGKQRDPDAHQAKKGNTWHFGYQAHIGVDKDSGLVHTLKVTAANVHDVAMTPELLTGQEESVYGDSIWEPKSAKAPWCATAKRKKSKIESIGARLKFGN